MFFEKYFLKLLLFSSADHCFFTIDGMPAGSNADRLAPGIYIERDHGKTRKFIKHLR